MRRQNPTDSFEIRWFRERATDGLVQDLGPGSSHVQIQGPDDWLSKYHSTGLYIQPYRPGLMGKYWCQVIKTNVNPHQPLMRSNVFTLLAPGDYSKSTCSHAAMIQTVGNVTCADLPDPSSTAAQVPLTTTPQQQVPLTTTPQQQVPSTTPQQQVPSTTPQQQVPSTTPQQQVPSTTPQQQLPSTTPQQQVPSTTPQQQVLSTTPQQQVLSTTPQQQVPTATPLSHAECTTGGFIYLSQPPSTTIGGCSPYQIGTNIINIHLQCVVRRQNPTDSFEIRWFRERASDGLVQNLGPGSYHVQIHGGPDDWLSRYHDTGLWVQPYRPGLLGKYWCQVIKTGVNPHQPLMRSNAFTLLAPGDYSKSTCSHAAMIQTVENVTCADLPDPSSTAAQVPTTTPQQQVPSTTPQQQVPTATPLSHAECTIGGFIYLSQPPSTTIGGCSPYQIVTNIINIHLQCVVRRQNPTDSFEIIWFRERATDGLVQNLGPGSYHVQIQGPDDWLSRYHDTGLWVQPYRPGLLGKYWCQVIKTGVNPHQPLMRSNVFTLLAPGNYSKSTCSYAAMIQTVENVTCADLPDPAGSSTAAQVPTTTPQQQVPSTTPQQQVPSTTPQQQVPSTTPQQQVPRTTIG